MGAAIDIQNLTKYYGKKRGIEQLTFSVECGEIFGFIGPNGAGKSTTIRTLLGFLHPTSGSAQILGMDIQKYNQAILQKVGYLPAESAFYAGMRVKDVLRLSANLRKCDCTQQAQVLCHRLELDVERKVDELSFGNKKKVAIVCALQHQPQLLLLDEPTSGLDPLMQHTFFEIVGEYNRLGTTVFLSSHVLSEVQRNCQRAAIVRDGRLVACDSVQALAKTNAKRVVVRGKFAVSSLEQVRDLSVCDDTTSFLYSGEMDALIHQLSLCKIQGLSLSEPDLEEIFLHYYQQGGAEK